jgi:hypothetical protein
MLRKDKVLLESLTKKYGKRNILNEISKELLIRARDKSKELKRYYQYRLFNNALGEISPKYKDNLYLEEFASEEGNAYYIVYKNGEICAVIEYGDCVCEEDYEFNFISEWLNIVIVGNQVNFNFVLDFFNKKTNNNFTTKFIEPKKENDVVSTAYACSLQDLSIGDCLFTNRSDARKHVKMIEIINNHLDTNYSEDWHNYVM